MLLTKLVSIIIALEDQKSGTGDYFLIYSQSFVSRRVYTLFPHHIGNRFVRKHQAFREDHLEQLMGNYCLSKRQENQIWDYLLHFNVVMFVHTSLL